MSFRRLRYFVAAAGEQNFGRAAKLMNVAVPALSRQIHQLEAELGVQLFRHVGRRVELSPAGARYLRHANDILASVERAKVDVAEYAKSGNNSLAIGMQEMGCFQDTLIEAIWDFRREAPQCSLAVEPMFSAPQVRAILDHKLDAGFLCAEATLPPSLSRLNVTIDQWYIAMPDHHPYATAEAVSMSDIVNDDFVFLVDSYAPELFRELFGRCDAAGFAPRIVRRANTMPSFLGLIAAGIGIGFFCTPIELPSSILLKPISDLYLPVPLDLVWRSDNTKSQLAHFIEVVSRRALSFASN